MPHKTPDWHKHIVTISWVSSVIKATSVYCQVVKFKIQVLVVGQEAQLVYL